MTGYEFRFGPLREQPDRTNFRLWAPGADCVFLKVEGAADQAMSRRESGWHELTTKAGPGTRYSFRVGDVTFPDPASRMQDKDVHDPSVVTGDGYAWRCGEWKGRPWEETVLYELHPGLFGGFMGMMRHLDRLAELGITAIELMPIADFPGQRNWGYDGVLPFAPDRAYGTPDELKALIDAAHERGLMVFLDVVYNHFGPDGNYLSLYAPQFFDQSPHTPWGSAIHFGQPEVRRFFIENAIYWLEEFRFDGLRFDAVHAICDKTFLPEMAREIRAAIPHRHVHLVLENDDNDAELLRIAYDAQWDDDLHHVLHVLLTREDRGYYEDYAQDSASKLARALSEGFVYQGDPSAFRDGARRGSPTAGLGPRAFVSFLQNHDQIGNRAFGERLTTLADQTKLEAAIALQLLAPEVPLIFMGEEVGAREPFLYFTDHQNPELADAVRKGRRQEFAKFPEFANAEKRTEIPDPNAPETFEKCVVDFAGNSRQQLYRELLALRHERIAPRLAGAHAESARAIGRGAVLARWRLGDGSALVIASNLGDEPVTAALPGSAPIWGVAGGDLVPPATTLAWIDS